MFGLGSFSIGRILGIPIRIHWTWLLYAGLFGLFNGTMAAFLFVLIFASVLLHELGHSAVAKLLGIPVRHITLYPLGGAAQMAAEPRHWTHEVAIAVAGPLVNFVLVAGLVPLGIFLPAGLAQELCLNLGIANLVLGLFNLVPAFPLDGGRVLKAVLTPRLGALRATITAASVGKYCAMGLGVLGLVLGHFMLVALAFFIWVLGQQEKQAAILRHQHDMAYGAPYAPPRPGVIIVDRRFVD